MTTPTPTPQRRTIRRADRYKQDSGVAPSSALMQQAEGSPAPAAQTPAPKPVPVRVIRTEQPSSFVQDERPAQPAQRSAYMQHAQGSRGLEAPRSTASRVTMVHQAEAAREPAPQKKTVYAKMPKWLFNSLIAGFFAILILFTANALMEAYVTTQENAREAAWQKVLSEHPMRYQDWIEKYAAENNLNPAFVAAIIFNESSFRPDAVSSVGARGLMQMMDDTALWIAGKLDVDTYTFDDMFDPEQNIRYGCWYLGYLAKMFGGDAVLVAAAYHTGQGMVTRWLSDPKMSPDGVTITLDNMMDGPTKVYAGRVTEDFAIYEAIYYPEKAVGADDGAGDASVFAGS